jgi:hypothetical protein
LCHAVTLKQKNSVIVTAASVTLNIQMIFVYLQETAVNDNDLFCCSPLCDQSDSAILSAVKSILTM